MARVMVPVTEVKYERLFPLSAAEALSRWADDDEYTYTMRVTVRDEVDREHVRHLLEKECPGNAEELIRLLDETEWDCSFFVDCF